MNHVTALRELIEDPEIVVLPGAHDVLSAKLIEQAGFSAVFTSGFGLAASTLGMPDVGLLTMTETLDRVKRIVDAVSIPVVADMDTGYGNPLNVVRTVYECVRLGVAGIILEDQLWPKKCGHMEGKRVIPIEEHVQKIRAAAYAREDSDLVIIARTDAVAPEGFDEAIKRGRAYSEAGADVIFVEAPQNMEQMDAVTRSFDTPVFANMVEGGKTPFLSAPELERLGFDMVVYPLSGLFASTRAIQEMAVHLKKTGTTDDYDTMATFSEFEKVIGLHDYNELEAKFGVGHA
ncbi:MAG: isocitrate lyase/PEP mutase family protein [SAR202 cluster bacterium]|nr:isocitrate lyase/PEP mutase family protein [SAR202 cluster bacterium]